jgi:hypothetical protein
VLPPLPTLMPMQVGSAHRFLVAPAVRRRHSALRRAAQPVRSAVGRRSPSPCATCARRAVGVRPNEDGAARRQAARRRAADGGARTPAEVRLRRASDGVAAARVRVRRRPFCHSRAQARSRPARGPRAVARTAVRAAPPDVDLPLELAIFATRGPLRFVGSVVRTLDRACNHGCGPRDGNVRVVVAHRLRVARPWART